MVANGDTGSECAEPPRSIRARRPFMGIGAARRPAVRLRLGRDDCVPWSQAQLHLWPKRAVPVRLAGPEPCDVANSCRRLFAAEARALAAGAYRLALTGL